METFLKRNHTAIYYGTINETMHMDMLAVLSLTELTRANQYVNDSDRNRFIVTRAYLKRIISTFLNKEIEDIDIGYEQFGKPFLKGDKDFHFNSSHTKDTFAIACSPNGKIGIDLESLNRDINIPKLEKFLFTPDELSQFRVLNNGEKSETFIHFWTMKEAILKATGEGLTKPMSMLPISNTESGKMKVPSKTTCTFNETKFFVENFNLTDYIYGTVAINTPMERVQYVNVNDIKW